MIKAAIVGLGWRDSIIHGLSPARNALATPVNALSRTRPYRPKAIVKCLQSALVALARWAESAL